MNSDSKQHRLIILASGSGSNAENIIKVFRETREADVVQVLTNNPSAGVIDRCRQLDVPCGILSPQTCKEGNRMLAILDKSQPDLIILAGYLRLIPAEVVERFEGRIVNIHPSLLPAYGGKGMYGMHVHEAVIRNGEKESGITIHLVNEAYDEGQVIMQQKVDVSPEETPDTLAEKIHTLEMKWFPEAIRQLLSKE
jgi:phosphoribosylglycinamide formyltransferase-1